MDHNNREVRTNRRNMRMKRTGIPRGSFKFKQKECKTTVLKASIRPEIWRQLGCKIKQLRFDFKQMFHSFVCPRLEQDQANRHSTMGPGGHKGPPPLSRKLLVIDSDVGRTITSCGSWEIAKAPGTVPHPCARWHHPLDLLETCEGRVGREWKGDMISILYASMKFSK